MAKIVGNNVLNLSGYAHEVRMWVHNEEWEGRKLVDIINRDHENPKYVYTSKA